MTTTEFDMPRQMTMTSRPTGVREMLLHEALARARMREAEEAARHDRLVRHLVVGRRWARLARYANQRAARAHRAL